MQYKPGISVILPCFNSEKYIAEAIASVLGQTYRRLELIVVDDGSTDHTGEIISGFPDPRITYLKNNRLKGNYPARNLGMRMAKGKYIAVMDADDIALPHRFEVQLSYMEKNPRVGLVGSDSVLINADGFNIGWIRRKLDYESLRVGLLKDNMLTHPTLFLRRAFMERFNLCYDEEYVYASDYDFVAKCADLFPVENIEAPLLKYRVHSDQITGAKRNDQIGFADKIRLCRLQKMGVAPSDLEKQLHLKLMKGEKIEEEQYEALEYWLNKILQSNQVNKKYDSFKLYNLLAQLAGNIK